MDDFFSRNIFPRVFFENIWYTRDFIGDQVTRFQRFINERLKNLSPFVYLFAENHLKTIIAYLGIIRAGKIAVLVDPAVRKLEFRDMIADTPPGAIIRINTGTLEFDLNDEIEFTNNTLSTQMLAELEDVCTIVYTAGEDGYEKGAMLTRQNMSANAAATNFVGQVSSKSIVCALLPFHHLFAIQSGLLSPILNGASVVVIGITDLRKIKSCLEQIREAKVTHLYSVPVFYYLFSAIPGISNYFDSSCWCFSGGSKLSENIFNIFKKNTGISIYEGYGLTEASPVCTEMYLDDPINICSVGKAVPGVQITVIDENDSSLPENSEGEVCIRGENVMKGYFNKPAQNRFALRNNWLHTGDLGKLDDKGFLYLTGMKKRMLNVGGKNVYPGEVERYLKECPFIRDAVVYGGESRIMGDTVSAKINLSLELTNSEEKIRFWCLEHISAFKIPRYFEFEH